MLSTPESLFAQCLAADYVAQKYQDMIMEHGFGITNNNKVSFGGPMNMFHNEKWDVVYTPGDLKKDELPHCTYSVKGAPVIAYIPRIKK